MTITPEQWREIEQSGVVRIEDPETHAEFVILKADVYDRLSASLALDQGEFHPSQVYPALDQAFAEGWNDPKMADYDEYEKYRP